MTPTNILSQNTPHASHSSASAMSEFVQAMARARRRSGGQAELESSLKDLQVEDQAKRAAGDAAAAAEPESAAVPKTAATADKKTSDKKTSDKKTSGAAAGSGAAETSVATSAPMRRGSRHLTKGDTLMTKSGVHLSEYADRFEALTALSVEEQAEQFLMQFVMEFRGRFNEVTDLALDFKTMAGSRGKGRAVQELDEFQCHQFLEKRGETLTVRDLRDKLREIDIDSNGSVALIEYLLFKYDKTLEDMFTETADGVDPELLAMLRKAMDQFKAVMAAKDKRQRKMDKLKARAAKGGVLGKSAAHELECMERQDETDRNRREITAAAAQRKAQRLVKNADKSEMKKKALAAEQKKQAEAEAARKAAEKTRRQESRARLAAKAAMFSK